VIVPFPLLVNLIKPAGVVGFVEVSVTVAVQVVTWPIATVDGAQLTAVLLMFACACGTFKIEVESAARRMTMLVMITSLVFKR